ncbi:hypothetical protein [Geobacter anodireducens]|uniref:Uncharacterized protein n=1 Tax=Geobacter anodireducens TaxID=1340425 RepID=A0ABR9NWZ2_9BACT|nr:hypothetical protein [Geobacter anodireducens]ANA41332.1 hypothetical protein A2G06_15000 [Geobacter anodireducens]MBE2888768.1 hypothetical protein [Geobacter anodireducens]
MKYLKWLYFTLISIILFSTNAIAHGGSQMEPSYLYEIQDFTSAQSLEPLIFTIGGGLFGGYRNVSVFPVPFDNAVGSNDMGNAITIISFPKGKIDYDRYFRNAADDMSGGGEFVSQTAKDILGYGQVRRFLLFDFKKKLHREYRIVFPITQYIEKIALADSERKRFLFEIESQKRNAKEPFDSNNFLQLIDLSDDKHKVIKEVFKPAGTIWTTTKERVFLYRILEKKLQVFDMKLEVAHHPLEDALKQYKDKIDFSRIYVHPQFPFAILRGKKGAVYIGWEKKNIPVPHLLTSGASQFVISPDGQWVVFKYERTGAAKTYLMPVSEKYPHYLGSPILLADTYFDEGKFAWTTNPTGFVGSRLDKIYHWDLENRDFPEKGTMSFHDYIVKNDLEKLTREKKQGLGNKH